MPLPWERQIGPDGRLEPPKCFSAFSRYLALGTQRSLDKLCSETGKKKNGRRAHHGRLAFWSKTWRFVERAAAWEEELARLAREAEAKVRVEMAARHAQAAVTLQEKALQRLAELPLKELDAATVVRALAEGQRLERLARGEPETVTERRNGNDDLFERVRKRAEAAAASARAVHGGSALRGNHAPQSLDSPSAN
jgi:hypothetical protein